MRGQLKSRATQTKRGKKSRQGAFGFGFGLYPHWLLARHFKPITRRSNHDRVITFDSHLKTVLVRVCELVTVLRDTFVDHDQLCCCLVSSACSVACLVQTVGSYWISSLSHSLCLWIVFIWLARSRESYFDGNNSSKVGRPYV